MKIVSQWKEVFFYSFFIALLFWITGTSIFSASELVKSVFPVVCGGWTYVSIYFAVLFFTPILNVILDKISFESGVLYLAVGVLLFSILPIVTTVEIWYSYLIWGMYLYILGGFIRKYNDRLLKAKRVFMMLLLLSVLIIAASVVVIGYLKDAGISIPYEVYILTRKNSPFALLGAVSALLISSSFKQSIAIVNRVASHVFGIYLIHTNRLVTDWLYEDVLRCSQVMGNTKIVHAIISVAAVFIVCLLIDVIREFIFTGTSKLRNSFEKT